MHLSLLTIVQGRKAQLINQAIGIEQSERTPDEWLIVGMNETPSIERSVLARLSHLPIRFERFDHEQSLPLAAARNHAASLAKGDGLIFLDVDCIPSPTLFNDFEQAMHGSKSLYMGSIGYLPKHSAEQGWGFDELRSLAVAHPLMPRFEDDTIMVKQRHELFWSLCFAAKAETFASIGGFDEGFIGYGGEDTDFAFRARMQGIDLKVIRSQAFHQYHSVCKPPLNHFRTIISNAKRFRDNWGVWPMESWLRAFAEMHLIVFYPNTDRLEILRDPTAEEVRCATVNTPAGF